MLLISMLAGCRLSHDDFLALQEQLRDTASAETSEEDTSQEEEPSEEDTSQEEEASEEDPENIKYIFMGEDDYLNLSRNGDPFQSPPWSFSFRLTKDIIQEGRLYSLFTIDNQSILMRYSNSLLETDQSTIEIITCPRPNSENICQINNIEREVETSFVAGDRITISVGEQNEANVSEIKVYQQGTPLGQIGDFKSTISGTNDMSFGRPVTNLNQVFEGDITDEDILAGGGWNAGIDSLILFDTHLTAIQVQSMIVAEGQNRILNFLTSPQNSEIDISFWTLGEDIAPWISDAIGDRDGETIGNTYVYKSHDSEE